jgi:hypothetical protein
VIEFDHWNNLTTSREI